jgi:hypothetical protein
MQISGARTESRVTPTHLVTRPLDLPGWAVAYTTSAAQFEFEDGQLGRRLGVNLFGKLPAMFGAQCA